MAEARGRSSGDRLRSPRRRSSSKRGRAEEPLLLWTPPAPPLSTAAAVLLAAGESTRMGELKALLPWEGGTLLEYQVAQLLQTPLAQVVVVLGHRAPELRSFLPRHEPRLRAVYNRRYRRGKSTSVIAGLEALTPGWQAVLVLGVDQPRPAWVLARLLDAQREAAPLLTVASHAGQRGHPVVFAAALGPELLAITEEQQGLREVVQRHAGEINQVEFQTPLVLVNLNTRQDYARARGLLRGAPER